MNTKIQEDFQIYINVLLRQLGHLFWQNNKDCEVNAKYDPNFLFSSKV